MADETVRVQRINPASDLTLLYVEDGDLARERLAAILAHRVARVIQARNGREGLDLYREHRPDIIVTDLRMPELDGIEMARIIKREDRRARIIFTTAFRDTGFLMDAIEVGVDAYLVKPVEVDRLFAAIDRCARLVALRREVERREVERQQLLVEYGRALDEVCALRGILPTCGACGRRRDDRNYWDRVDAYVRGMDSVASAFHGLCPDCVRRLHGGPADGAAGKEPG